ncbi:Protein CBG27370 [Caenorhabditis briggsae]|uniref:Protein CBG27370 n=2 Tax=Caenorhabditis briggsae TaxID=6238 RepID=B6IGH0_CAEBR|nr:Protein CBG27370 [Caenorhabditis briggsae]ULT88288.1 hypothetical protein L3Y34_007467 [Caenorhabditis briggsae]CAR99000.1 Protein CBG27370 [Caenorhabditis briggsae]
MNRIAELKEFAKEKEKESKDKLLEYRQNLEEKITTCDGIIKRELELERERLTVIKPENESPECPININNEIPEIQDFHSNLNGILEFYKEQLIRIGQASKRIEECLPLDFANVKLEEKKSQEYYKKIINDGYDSVLKMFIETGRAITNCCKVIVDIADKNHCEELGLFGKIYVPIMTVAKFLLPVQRISDVLNETLEQIDFRDASPSNSNDSNQRDEACGKLKDLAKQLVKNDNEIKSACCHLFETISDSFGLEEELRKHFASFLKKYYDLDAKYGIIHLHLCGYESPELPEKQQILDYLKEINSLRAEVQDSVNRVVEKLSEEIRKSLENKAKK